MELREWAISILDGKSLEEKLYAPSLLTDENPGPSLRWDLPQRPAGMGFHRFSKKEKLPPFHEHSDPDKRAICLHRFAGHELLAIEMMAYALLAFPEAPKTFRKGVAHTLQEEQEHVRLYQQRLQGLGTSLGDHPLNGRFWTLTSHLRSPLEYISVMHLTLEMANLDFAPHYGASFARYGDVDSSALMQRILQDEISHVSFGYRWLKTMKPPHLSEWQTWLTTLSPITSPKRARGFIFQEAPRKAASIPQEWIDHLKNRQY